MLIVQVAGVAVAYLFLDKAELAIQGYMDMALKNSYQAQFEEVDDDAISYSSNGDPITLAFDLIQVEVCSILSLLSLHFNQSLFYHLCPLLTIF